MRILHLTPGTGSFHCGSCLRDNALVKALRARGHDAMMVPLYLPLVTDADDANPEQAVRVGEGGRERPAGEGANRNRNRNGQRNRHG